ncbi:MAG: T9SS type A sorting domain-containing protein [Candidatus Zixiibacteriota bacterium]
MKLFSTVVTVLVAAAAIVLAAPPEKPSKSMPTVAANFDNQHYVDAGNILMFVTNYGELGRDVTDIFGYDFGTFYPYAGVDAIHNGTLTSSPLWSCGLWLGGVDSATGQTRIALSEYSSEYVPGPMAGGTFQPDQPGFRVYKLYRDSLAGNPNQDYLEIPLGQGVPVDSLGHLLMLGDQMLWAVYNDADPNQHWNNAGATQPLGIEVRQTVWASESSGSDFAYLPNKYSATAIGPSSIVATAYVVDPVQITGDEYLVEVSDDPVLGPVWSLVNLTDNIVLLSHQTDFDGGDDGPVVEGFRLSVRETMVAFSNFEAVANAAGPLVPSEGAAAQFAGFPSASPTDRQQVGDGEWLIHTGDDGGTSGGGTRGDYNSFVSRTTRSGALTEYLKGRNLEIRFTGSNDYPGVGGSYAYDGIEWTGAYYWVPFELWDIGSGTPDDPSNDYQLVPWLWDWDQNGIFNLSNWGTTTYGGGGYEHSVSAGDNDPYTDWIYFQDPSDHTPGRAGYLAAEADMRNGTYSGERETEILARIVFVNWNGGDAPPFTQDMPETGTIFRITTKKGYAVPDSLTFTATRPQAIATRAGGEGNAVYIRYDLVNEGNRTIRDMYICLWSDPDLGGASDDLVGCDTLNNLWFCYNATNMDMQYGHSVPAVGLRSLVGPVVPSHGDTAQFFGHTLFGYRNLPMSAFNKYINGTDPNSYAETYNYMRGLNSDGTPLPNGTRFMHPGDPVAGTGDLDVNPSDRRMMASYGPFTFRPGDSQQVIFKMAVGQGTDRLSSITELKRLLLSTRQLEVDPPNLEFTYTLGGSTPPPQAFTVNALGGASIGYHASESIGWLTLSNAISSTPGTVTAVVNPAGLQADTYTADVTVESDDALTLPEHVTVTLKVLQPSDVVHPTDQWVNLYCSFTTLDGIPLQMGGTIDVLDPTGVLCGRGLVDINGAYGFLPVYRDDTLSHDIDEGAVPGDTLRFRIGWQAVYPERPIVWTSNGDRIEVCQFFTSRETCLPLHTGWNLISWNIDTPDDDVASVAASVMENATVILSFEQGGLTYDPTLPQFSTLRSADHLHGYWFLMRGPDTLCLDGPQVPDYTGIPLEAGWNIAPYFPGFPMSVEIADATIADRLLVAYSFDNGIQIWQPGSAFNTLTEMHRYRGYWLKMASPGIWYQVRSDCTMVISPITTASKTHEDELVTSPTWVNLYAQTLVVDGARVPEGTGVVARSKTSEKVGMGSVGENSSFGFMPVYGNVESASGGIGVGEPFFLEIDGALTNEPMVWSGNGNRLEVPALTSRKSNLPHRFWLGQNYPNPFNPTTTIRFSLATAAHYTLTIYNLAGQKVAQFDGDGDPGEQTVRWDASGCASGIYLYRLNAGEFTASRKMLLVK